MIVCGQHFMNAGGAGRSRMLPLYSFQITCIPCGRCQPARPTIHAAGHGSNVSSAGRGWPAQPAVKQVSYGNGGELFGSHGSGKNTIRDDRDFANHLDYIHFNPVKHGHSCNPSEWPYSSFQRFEKLGWYAAGWGKQLDDLQFSNIQTMANTVGE